MRSAVATLLTALSLVLAFGAAPASARRDRRERHPQRDELPTAQTAAGLGAGWVRLWASWEQAQPSPNGWAADVIYNMNAAANAAKAQGLKVLMVVQRTPAWANGGKGATHPPSDPSTFGAAMGDIAQARPRRRRVGDLERAGRDDLLGRRRRPAPSTPRCSKSAYPAIKAAQPNDVVVTGATTGNNYDFVEALYAHGAKGSFDAVGVHTDTACLVNHPDVHYRDEHGRVGRYSFTGYREVHARDGGATATAASRSG